MKKFETIPMNSTSSVNVFIRFLFFALLTLQITTPLKAASFDCQKAGTAIEIAICSNSQLSLLDEQLDAAHKAGVEKAKDKDAFRSDIKKWFDQTRNKCGSIQCLFTVYDSRLLNINNPDQPSSQKQNVDTPQQSESVAAKKRCELAPNPKAAVELQAEQYFQIVITARKNRCSSIAVLESSGFSKAAFDTLAKAEQGGALQNAYFRSGCQMLVNAGDQIRSICK